MHIMGRHLNLYIIILTLYCVVAQDLPFVTNYDQRCMKCICEGATGCDLTRGCEKGYCGPFKISRVFWVDAGKIILSEDEIDREGAYEDCALSYNCAQNIILGYFYKYGKDCNGDGITNCDDYAMIHFNGRNQCQPPVNRTQVGKEWWDRYINCGALRRY